MQIKRIKTLVVGSREFSVHWDKEECGGSFSYRTLELHIGTDNSPTEILEVIIHELIEMVAIENNVRYNRPDVDSDYLFSYDHRQHTTMVTMLTGLLNQFLK